MGFGFNLFILFILFPSTLGLLIYYIFSKKRNALIVLIGLWILTILVFISGSVADRDRRPLRLTKHDIIGEYRIDTTYYPGKNAIWQYQHFKFYITNDDSILFVVMRDKEITANLIKHKINFLYGPPDLWKIEADSTHHVIMNQPTLYRKHDQFYYVFNSKRFGNMFFRKISK